jgi:hypothetical protein
MTSIRLQARIAGVFYFVAVLVAVVGEFFAPGKLGAAAIAIPVACYALVTLLMYVILRPVSKSISVLMACFSLVGLTLEVFQWQPGGVDVAMVFHGLYCLLAGVLVFRSNFLPRVLGVLMAFAGIVWLLYLSPGISDRLAPYNTVAGLLGEASLMLWLLVMAVSVPRWNEQPERRAASDHTQPESSNHAHSEIKGHVA